MEGFDEKKTLTAEAFLIAEYQRMKAENDRLREEVAEANAKAEEAITSKNGEGVLCLTNCITDCVYVSVETGNYALFNSSDAPLRDITAFGLRELADKNDDALYTWGRKTKVSYSTIISENTRKFAGYVEYAEFDHIKRRYIDPRYMEDMYAVSEEPATSAWCPVEMQDEVRHLAAQELREVLTERADKLESEED